MDVNRLKQYPYLTKEIALLRQKQRTSPHQPQPHHEHNDQVTGRIEDLRKECGIIEAYIAGVEDSRIRQILTLRYLQGEAWGSVAAYFGHMESEGSVKMAAKRFLSKF